MSSFDARTNRMIWTALVALVCACFAAPAWAQDAPAAPADGAGADGEATEEEDQGPVDPIPTDIDPDDPMYWATVRGVETVQRREILKEGRFAVSAYGGIIPNNIFEQYVPVGLRLNYFVLEQVGLELSGNYALAMDTGLTATLKDDQGAGASAVLLGDKQISHVNFGVMWTPVFGKLAWRNKSLNYFDFYLLGGVGTLIKSTEATINGADTTGFVVEGTLGAGFFFFFNEHVALRTDYRQFIFGKGTGGVANPSEVSVGATYMF